MASELPPEYLQMILRMEDNKKKKVKIWVSSLVISRAQLAWI